MHVCMCMCCVCVFIRIYLGLSHCVVYSLRLFVYSRQLCYLAVPFVGLVHGPES